MWDLGRGLGLVCMSLRGPRFFPFTQQFVNGARTWGLAGLGSG